MATLRRLLVLAALLAACTNETIKVSDRCQPEGSVCVDGQVCQSGACVPCTANDQCGGLACLANRCRTCSDDFQCGVGKLCLGGNCTGCQKSADCPLSQACVASTCVPCASSTDCGDGRACIDQKCEACARDTQCDNGKVCLESACVACADTRQCHDGLACLAGACQACTDATQCLAGDVCAGGRCGACASRDQCPAGEICGNGHCSRCASADDCEQGEACLGGLCGRCTATDDCRQGQVCRDGVCGRCGSNAECAGGHICVAGACSPCTSRAQCDTGLVCLSGACQACATESQCLPGEACAQGRCGACVTADDCAAGEGCALGSCGPCTTSSQCRASEICHGSTHRCGAPGAADHLELVSGQNQRGTVGTRAAQDVGVRVVDAAGDPVPATDLAFEPATAASGRPGASPVTSDRDGLASTTWRLGPTAGPQQLVVSRHAPALPDAAHTGRAAITFAAQADADVADHLEIVAGNSQTATAGVASPQPLQVRAVDRWGNGIPLVTLVWTVTAGGGKAEPTGASTGATGAMAAVFTPGAIPGPNTVVVSRAPALPDVTASGRATATFAVTGTTGPADHLDKVAGDHQTGKLRATLVVDPQVRAVDRFGNPVVDASLRFAATGGCEPADSVVATGAQGLASVHFVVGSVAGGQTLTVSGASAALPDVAATGRAWVAFAETAVPGDPDHLELLAGDGQTAIVGTTLPIAPRVRVVDAFGNALSGVSISFGVTSGGGSVAAATVASGSDGSASTAWTLGFNAGAQALRVQRAGSPLPDLAGSGHAAVTFGATAPSPTATGVTPAWLPIAGGTLTLTGDAFGSDAAVTIGGQSATVTSRSATQLVVTAPSVARGAEPVVVTSGGVSTAPLSVFYALKFTPVIDGAIIGDWPVQSMVAANVYPAGDPKAGLPVDSSWSGNELRELYLGYDDSNVYIGVKGVAEKQNAIVGYIWEDGVPNSRGSASGDIRLLTDYYGDYMGDGNGYGTGTTFSIDDMLSAGFNVTVPGWTAPGWTAHYGFGRTGNAVDITGALHNAVGVRDLAPIANFGWLPSTVLHTANAQEFSIPWRTFAVDNGAKITQLKVWVRVVGSGGQAFPNQGLPADAKSIASDYLVTSVATLDVR